MCGRIVYVWDPITRKMVQQIIDETKFDPAVQHIIEKRRYNVPPASHLPIAVGRPGATSLKIARWGFPIPQRPNGVFNTRVENATTSPMWAGMFGHADGHAVLVAKGFYEWKRNGAKRTRPHFVSRQDGEAMALACLAGTRQVGGETKLCFSILTCAPNPMMQDLHDRMPVILEPEEVPVWLEGRQAIELADPAPDGTLTMHEVNPAVGDTKNDQPDLMEPIERTGLGAFL